MGEKNKSYKGLTLSTAAWYGDSPLTIYFPDNWNVISVMDPDSEELTNSQISATVRHPVGVLPLSKSAQGKRQVAILIDDIQRPTPVKKVLPFILDELQRAGIKRDNITAVMATACHRQATKEDFIKKLGEEVFHAVKTLSHDCRNGLTYLGETSRGTPVYVNSFVVNSDFKIGISGVYPHKGAGFGGGSKIVHPGVCGIQTTRHFHGNLKGVSRGNVIDNEFRADIEEIAEKVGLDFSVNVLINRRREIIHLSCGHRIQAHREAARLALDFCGVKPIEDADINIINSYPFDTSLYFVHKALWPLNFAKGNSTNVIIASCPEGSGFHALSPETVEGLRGFILRLRAFSRHDLYRFLSQFKQKEKKLLFYPPFLTQRVTRKYYHKARVISSWDPLLQALESKHGYGDVKVAVYACSPLQFPRIPNP